MRTVASAAAVRTSVAGPLACLITKAVVATCLLSSPAQAQFSGLNLSWDDCGVSGNLNKDFACDSNEGVSVLVPSVGIVGGTPLFVRSSIVFCFSGAMPSWWALQTGGCRAGALSMTPEAPGLTGCLDYWGTHQGLGVAVWAVVTDSKGTPLCYKIDMLSYTTEELATPLDGETEIYSGLIRFDHRKAAGADSCGGCGINGGFTYLSATIATTDFPGGRIINSPINREYVFWQHGIVPTRRRTWGGVKSLYR